MAAHHAHRAAPDSLVPEGFVPRPLGGGFLRHAGPIYVRREAEGPSRYGFLVGEQHCNGKDICHGGALATLADVVLGLGGFEQAGVSGFFTTVSLNNDFLAPAPLGAWIEARVELLARTRSLLFVQGLFTAGATPVLRSSGVFRLPQAARGERADETAGGAPALART